MVIMKKKYTSNSRDQHLDSVRFLVSHSLELGASNHPLFSQTIGCLLEPLYDKPHVIQANQCEDSYVYDNRNDSDTSRSDRIGDVHQKSDRTPPAVSDHEKISLVQDIGSEFDVSQKITIDDTVASFPSVPDGVVGCNVVCKNYLFGNNDNVSVLSSPLLGASSTIPLCCKIANDIEVFKQIGKFDLIVILYFNDAMFNYSHIIIHQSQNSTNCYKFQFLSADRSPSMLRVLFASFKMNPQLIRKLVLLTLLMFDTLFLRNVILVVRFISLKTLEKVFMELYQLQQLCSYDLRSFQKQTTVPIPMFQCHTTMFLWTNLFV